MAHFAELDQNNIVQRVIVVNNNDILDVENKESEEIGIAFCKSLLGNDTIWIQTSYNESFRKNYAGTGFTYDSERDAFIPPKPYNSWLLDEQTCQWKPPVERPIVEGKLFDWDEETKSWFVLTEE